jgi:hypothetical protein
MKPRVIPHAQEAWVRPTDGIINLNVDDAYIAQTGAAGAGMILRHGDGPIIFSACRALRFCSPVLASELIACMEGITMGLESSEERRSLLKGIAWNWFQWQIIQGRIALASDIWWHIYMNYLPLVRL